MLANPLVATTNVSELLPAKAMSGSFIVFPTSDDFVFDGDFPWLCDCASKSDKISATPENAVAFQIYSVLKEVKVNENLANFILQKSENEIEKFVCFKIYQNTSKYV